MKGKRRLMRFIVCFLVIVIGITVFSQMTKPVKDIWREFKNPLKDVLSNETVDYLVLVNHEHKIADNYNVSLVTYQDYQMEVGVRDALVEMMKGAEIDGVTLVLNNAYRSIALQSEIFQNKIKMYQDLGYSYDRALEKTRMQVQEPGYSEHQTGLAIDFSKESDTELNQVMWDWLDQNAYKYGFIKRYPDDKVLITKIDYEAWHYRYVGKKDAKEMFERNLCLEEYLNL